SEPDRDDPLPARLRGALLEGAGFRAVARPPGDLRPRPAAYAQRRIVLPAPAGNARAARLHHQQCLPDGAPAARVLRAHDGRGEAGIERSWFFGFEPDSQGNTESAACAGTVAAAAAARGVHRPGQSFSRWPAGPGPAAGGP